VAFPPPPGKPPAGPDRLGTTDGRRSEFRGEAQYLNIRHRADLAEDPRNPLIKNLLAAYPSRQPAVSTSKIIVRTRRFPGPAAISSPRSAMAFITGAHGCLPFTEDPRLGEGSSAGPRQLAVAGGVRTGAADGTPPCAAAWPSSTGGLRPGGCRGGPRGTTTRERAGDGSRSAPAVGKRDRLTVDADRNVPGRRR